MAKIPNIAFDPDADSDTNDIKCQTRPLGKDEPLPRIPTMFEQMNMAWVANNKAPAQKSR